MIRFLGYILALAVLGGLAYAILTYGPKISQQESPNIVETQKDGTQINTEVVAEESAAYRIEVHYPQFGISVIDAKIKAVVDRAVTAFKAYPANPPDSSVPQNEMTGSYDALYMGGDAVSVRFSFSEYTGGAHPNTAIVGVNVDPKTGREMNLEDALAMIGLTLEQVATKSLTELNAKLGASVIAPEGAAAKAENYSTFLVSKDKVTFVFQNYQVAPYSSGPQEVSFARIK